MKDLVSILKELSPTKVIDAGINYSEYVSLELSAENLEFINKNLQTSADFENYISDYLKKNNAKVAYGGYIETRTLYQRSEIFRNNLIPERNIHIGLDLWTKAETPVLAALHGKIHSFKSNNNLGDYGPTIILEHEVEKQKFYTLYGHLSLESIEKINVGDFFKQGEQLATLGKPAINGDYAPHLHFQIIKSIGDYLGDYPGVCNKNDLDFYTENCPDPNLLLKII